MSERNQVVLKDTWLAAVGRQLGELNVLSPFAGVEDGGDVQAELVEHGLMDAQGQLTEPAASALRRLARPRFASRLLCFAPPTSLEYIMYFDGGAEPVCMMDMGDGYVVQWPAMVEEAAGFLVEFAGVSTEPATPVALELPYREARAALAAVDLVRQAALAHVAAERDLPRFVVTFKDILARLEPDSTGFHRLESLLRQLDLGDEALSPPDLKLCLDALVEKGLLEEDPSGGWTLADALLLILDGFLYLNGHFRADTLRADEASTVSGGRGVAAQAGPRNLLYMEHDDGIVRMTAVSGTELAEVFSSLFGVGEDGMPLIYAGTTPPAADQPATPEPPPAVEEAPKFCGKCGSPVEAGVKFCGKCGNPMG